MCRRYTLKEDEKFMEDWFGASAGEFGPFGPNYNVAPSQNMPVIEQNRKGERTIRIFRWGLLPDWAKDEKVSYKMIDARSENIDSKKSYTKPFERYRCLVPASGFYEWTGEKGNKTPYYIFPTHEPLFAFAGLYNEWESPDGEKIPTYSIITTHANKKMSALHDRMPVMLLKEEWDEWLNPDNYDTKSLKELLNPFPDDAIDFHQVNKKVGKVSNNTADLIEKVI